MDKFAADDDGISAHHLADTKVAGLTGDVEVLLRVAILRRGLRLGGAACKSGPQRVRDLLTPEEAEAALKKRYVYVNVWRSISGAVEEAPLGICDATSIAEDDMVLMDLKYDDRIGEIHRTKYNPDHRWVYFPQMVPDEVILLKCYDTKMDGRARWTAHSAFDDPTSPANAAPRQSIETRSIAFYD